MCYTASPLDVSCRAPTSVCIYLTQKHTDIPYPGSTISKGTVTWVPTHRNVSSFPPPQTTLQPTALCCREARALLFLSARVPVLRGLLNPRTGRVLTVTDPARLLPLQIVFYFHPQFSLLSAGYWIAHSPVFAPALPVTSPHPSNWRHGANERAPVLPRPHVQLLSCSTAAATQATVTRWLSHRVTSLLFDVDVP